MSPNPEGLHGFLLIWVGQVFLIVGSHMTHFAMGIRAWQETMISVLKFFSGILVIGFGAFQIR